MVRIEILIEQEERNRKTILFLFKKKPTTKELWICVHVFRKSRERYTTN